MESLVKSVNHIHDRSNEKPVTRNLQRGTTNKEQETRNYSSFKHLTENAEVRS